MGGRMIAHADSTLRPACLPPWPRAAATAASVLASDGRPVQADDQRVCRVVARRGEGAQCRVLAGAAVLAMRMRSVPRWHLHCPRASAWPPYVPERVLRSVLGGWRACLGSGLSHVTSRSVDASQRDIGEFDLDKVRAHDNGKGIITGHPIEPLYGRGTVSK